MNEPRWNPFIGGLSTPWYWKCPEKKLVYSARTKADAIAMIARIEVYIKDELVEKLKRMGK
jgi:hypothetical protein